MKELEEFDLNDAYATIQGEGCLTGVPMIALRLHGCPVGCPFCDTKETWERSESLRRNFNDTEEWQGASPNFARAPARDIAWHAREIAGSEVNWIMLTGGEPAMQKLKPLIDALHDNGFAVALETSGTADGHIGAGCDWVCISPKINMPGRRAINPLALREASEIKFVIGKEADVEKMERFYSDFIEHIAADRADAVERCVQPMSQSPKATELCLKLARERGYRVSIQVHKYLGLA